MNTSIDKVPPHARGSREHYCCCHIAGRFCLRGSNIANTQNPGAPRQGELVDVLGLCPLKSSLVENKRFRYDIIIQITEDVTTIHVLWDEFVDESKKIVCLKAEHGM